jgi:hypothetical protein
MLGLAALDPVVWTHRLTARPSGLLVFTRDRRFVEVLTDADVSRFASGPHGQGMAGSSLA